MSNLVKEDTSAMQTPLQICVCIRQTGIIQRGAGKYNIYLPKKIIIKTGKITLLPLIVM